MCPLHCYAVTYCLLGQLFFILPYRRPHVFRGARHCSCVLPTSYKQKWSYTSSGTWSIQKGSGVHLPPYNIVVVTRQCKRQTNWCPASSLGHALNDRIANEAKQNDDLYQLPILNPPNLDDMDGSIHSYPDLQLPDTSKIQDRWIENQRTRMRYIYDGAQLLQWAASCTASCPQLHCRVVGILQSPFGRTMYHCHYRTSVACTTLVEPMSNGEHHGRHGGTYMAR